MSGDNAVILLPDDGKAAAVIRVDAAADDQSAQSQQFGSPAAADAAHLNSGARQRRREQRQRCADVTTYASLRAAHHAPVPAKLQRPVGSCTFEAADCGACTMIIASIWSCVTLHAFIKLDICHCAATNDKAVCSLTFMLRCQCAAIYVTLSACSHDAFFPARNVRELRLAKLVRAALQALQFLHLRRMGHRRR